ncbi:MAG: hypothetical protein P9X24_17425 [Candidatus Hatepunaea meridiana]|nr:hypothetical protein [Candidatus Hatepunaea meridiana]
MEYSKFVEKCWELEGEEADEEFEEVVKRIEATLDIVNEYKEKPNVNE